jgi:hypothetical protein
MHLDCAAGVVEEERDRKKRSNREYEEGIDRKEGLRDAID